MLTDIDEARAPVAVAAAQRRIAPLVDLPAELAGLLTLRRAALAGLAENPHLSPVGQAAQAALVNQAARDRVLALQTQATQAQEAARAHLSGARRTLDTAAATLAELRAARLWSRALTQLAAGQAPEAVITAAAAAGDREMIATLRAELPAWVVAQYPTDSHAAAAVIDGLLARLTAVETPLLPPGAAQVQAVEADLERGAYRVNLALTYALAEVTGPEYYPVNVLPAWDAATVLPVETQAL